MHKIVIDYFGKNKFTSGTSQNKRFLRTLHHSKQEENHSRAYNSFTCRILKRTLKAVVTMNDLTNNIVSKFKGNSKNKAKIDYWTKEEFERVISNIYIDDFYEHLCFVMLWVYFTTGIRIYEGCSLWWNDIDLKKKKMRIHPLPLIKTNTDWEHHLYSKNKSRTISLDDDTIEILKVWKNRQEKKGVKQFVFSHDNSPMQKSIVSKMIKHYARLAEVTEIQVKGLRYSNVAYLINDFNTSVFTISKRLGHSSPRITLKHYAHLWNDADKELTLNMTGAIKIKPAQQKFFTSKNTNVCL